MTDDTDAITPKRRGPGRPRKPPAPPPDPDPTAKPRYRGCNGSRQHPKARVAEALAEADIHKSTPKAELVSGIPARSIRHLRAFFRAWPDSELEALVAREKRVSIPVYVIMEAEMQDFAYECRVAGKAKDALSAMTAAGICGTKSERAGQPQQVQARVIEPPTALSVVPGLRQDSPDDSES